MPIWLRKFTFHKMQEYYNNQKSESESTTNSNIKTLIDSNGKVQSSELAKKSKPVSYK